MEYMFKSGEKVQFEDIVETNDMEKLFKFNLPSTKENYISGNGEGVWACGNSETLSAVNMNEDDGIYFAMILNDSVYYPKLQYGSIVAIEMRRGQRPIAIFDELSSKYEVDFEGIERTKAAIALKMMFRDI